jgi:O-antigen/teichoic acid export membrane protein
MLIAVIIRMVYGYYCKKHFAECTYQVIFDKSLLQQMFGFAGWNFIGASSAVLRGQGGNIVINLFCGPTVNAAQGIAMQVSHAIQGFVSNFMTALNPQITKSYASGNHDYMMTLIFQGARLSFYILLIFSLPVIVNAQYILSLWLGTVPNHTVAFVQLVLIFAMSESLASPLVTAMLATGKIRNYQLVVGGLQTLNLPVSYVLLRIGFIPETIFITAIVISVCCEMARLYMLRNMINLPVRNFLKKVYFNVIVVFVLASIVPYVLKSQLNDNFSNFIIICSVCLFCTLLSILFIGCNRKERMFVYERAALLRRKLIHR